MTLREYFMVSSYKKKNAIREEMSEIDQGDIIELFQLRELFNG